MLALVGNDEAEYRKFLQLLETRGGWADGLFDGLLEMAPDLLGIQVVVIMREGNLISRGPNDAPTLYLVRTVNHYMPALLPDASAGLPQADIPAPGGQHDQIGTDAEEMAALSSDADAGPAGVVAEDSAQTPSADGAASPQSGTVQAYRAYRWLAQENPGYDVPAVTDEARREAERWGGLPLPEQAKQIRGGLQGVFAGSVDVVVRVDLPLQSPLHTRMWFGAQGGFAGAAFVLNAAFYLVFDPESGSRIMPAQEFVGWVGGRGYTFVVASPMAAQPADDTPPQDEIAKFVALLDHLDPTATGGTDRLVHSPVVGGAEPQRARRAAARAWGSATAQSDVDRERQGLRRCHKASS